MAISCIDRICAGSAWGQLVLFLVLIVMLKFLHAAANWFIFDSMSDCYSEFRAPSSVNLEILSNIFCNCSLGL